MNLNSTASWIGHRKKTGGCDVGDLKRRFERIFYILYIYIYIYMTGLADILRFLASVRIMIQCIYFRILNNNIVIVSSTQTFTKLVCDLTGTNHESPHEQRLQFRS